METVLEQKIYRVLLIEDNNDYRKLIKKYLDTSRGIEFELREANRLITGLHSLLNEIYDVLIFDLTLPDVEKLEALDKIISYKNNLPIILIVERVDEALAINAVKNGVQDYLVKGQFDKDILVSSLIHAMGRNHLNKNVQLQKEQFNRMIEPSNNFYFIINTDDYTIQIPNSESIILNSGNSSDIKCYSFIHGLNSPCSENNEICPLKTVVRVRSSVCVERTRFEKDGNVENYELHCHPLFDENGKVKRVIEYLINNSERKKIRLNLSKKEEQYQSFFNRVPIGLYQTTLDGSFITANSTFLEIIGVSSFEELSFLNAKDIANELSYSRDKFEEIIERDGKVIGFETQIQKQDGSIILIRENAKAIKDADNNILFIEGSVEDITDYKETEVSLQKSEEKFRSLFDISRDAIGIFNSSGTILDANKAYLYILGYSLEEIRSRNIQDFTPSKWQVIEKEIMRSQVLDQGYSDVYEKEIITKDGTIVPIEVRISLLENENKNHPQMFSIIRDISQRKKIAQELKKRTTDLNEILKDLDCLYGVSQAIKDPSKPLNEVFQEILTWVPLAWTYPDITTARIIFDGKEYTTESFKDSIWSQSADIVTSGRKVGVLEVFYKEEKVGINEGPFSNEERNLINNLALMIGEFIERKTVEERLNFEHKSFCRVLNSIVDGVYIVNDQYEIEFINSTLKEEFGSVDGKKCYQYFLDRSEVCPWCQNKTILSGQTVQWEWFISKNQRTYDRIDTPFRKFDGSISKLAIFRDVTDRKEMEERIREKEEKFRSIFNQVFDALFITDKTGRIIDVNIAACELLGYDKKELTQLFLRDILLKKGFKRILKLIDRILKGKNNQLGEITFLTKNGKEIIAEGGGSTIEIGNERYFIGSFRDITERIQWEDELKNRLMKFNIEGGNIYIIKEKTTTFSLEVFNDLLNVGYNGHIISRIPEVEFKKSIEKNIEYLWLAEKNKKESNLSFFDSIEKISEDKLRKSVIFIVRLDYLISKYGFKETINFVYKLNEIAYLKSLVILLSIDPSTVDSHELSLLEKETKEITPRFMAKIPEVMLEILRFIFRMNNLGMKPSYSEVRDELQISRPTVSKRIKHLVATGYLGEELKGNRKILELTQKGRMLFSI